MTGTVFQPSFSCSEQPPMAGDYVLPLIDQNRDVETKRLDAMSDLAYLLFSMDARVLWMRFERCYREVGYF